MKKGATGEYVKILQKELGVTPDGDFGPKTEEAVKTWQRSKGLVPDGDFGPKSWSKLLCTDIKRSTRSVSEVIVHCTADPEGKTNTVENISKEHRKKFGCDCGYHYVIYLDSSIHIGRDVNKMGTHCSGHNTGSIGIAYVGGLANLSNTPYNKLPAKDTRTPNQKKRLALILACMRDLYPKAKFLGHRDTSPDKNKNGKVDPWEWTKSCPSFDVATEYPI